MRLRIVDRRLCARAAAVSSGSLWPVHSVARPISGDARASGTEIEKRSVVGQPGAGCEQGDQLGRRCDRSVPPGPCLGCTAVLQPAATVGPPIREARELKVEAMTLQLDPDERLAVVDEIIGRVPTGGQKRLAIALAAARGTQVTTETAQVSRLLNKKPEVVAQMLGPEEAEGVLGAICNELPVPVSVRDLVHAARRAARSRRPVPDRHPAWQELGDAVSRASRPGSPRYARRSSHTPSPPVVWLVGPAGSGKSAWLWRLEQQKIGERFDEVPVEPAAGAVWLVDEPPEPAVWIAEAARCGARLVIATPTPHELGKAHVKLELELWTGREVDDYLDELHDARGAGCSALDAVDLERIADALTTLGTSWTPLDLGNIIRLLIDEPVLLDRDGSDRELRIRSSLHALPRRTELRAALVAKFGP